MEGGGEFSVSSEGGFGDPRGCAVAPRAQVLVHHAPGGVFATAAAGTDRQFVLYVEERACTAIDSLADVFVGYSVANADVHGSPRYAGGAIAAQ
jgi:hypothetical protein